MTGTHEVSGTTRIPGWSAAVRFLRLHLRARGAARFTAGLVMVALAGWAVADWLLDSPSATGPDARIPVVVMAPMLGAVVASLGLGGADEEMERTTPARWRLFRALHVGVAATLAAGAMALVGLWEPRFYGAFELVRNTLGFFGLVALATVVMGHRLAWVPSFGYAVLVLVVTPRPITTDTAWWTWPMQPWSADAAIWAASVVFGLGLVAYVVAGARPIRDATEA